VFSYFRNPDTNPDLLGEDGKPLPYSLKTNRRKIHAYVYEGSSHVNLDSIEAVGPRWCSATRRRLSGSSATGSSPAAVRGCPTAPGLRGGPMWLPQPPEGTSVCGGFDGSENDDHTVIKLETRRRPHLHAALGP
jgi:hypothetical protein